MRSGVPWLVIPQQNGTCRYQLVKEIGRGTFGIVFEAVDSNGKHVSVKAIPHDPHFKSTELDILSSIDHPNVLHLRGSFFLRTESNLFLNIVSDLMPMDLTQFMRERPQSPQLAKVFIFQLFRALAYIHSKGICHRDVKPSNVLVDPDTGRAQLCDFGSAVREIPGQSYVSYIATRSYRAPELLFGSTHYTQSVDVWAAGCVAAQMANDGKPIFTSSSNKEMVKIIAESLGSPTEADMREISGTESYDGETIPAKEMKTLLPEETPPLLVDLLSRIFVYAIAKRFTAENCLQHPYFDDIRAASIILPNGHRFLLPTK